MKQNTIALEEKKRKRRGELGNLGLTNEKDFLGIKLWNLYCSTVFLLLWETEMT